MENRTWTTTPGTVAIHAALRYDQEAVRSLPMQEAWGRLGKGPLQRRGSDLLMTGVILGTVDIVGVHLCDARRGCYQKADVLGWAPVDGRDASREGWAPRFCSRWGDVPDRPPVRGSGHTRHFVLANPRPLTHPIPFMGHLGIRRLDPEVEATLRLRLESQ